MSTIMYYLHHDHRKGMKVSIDKTKVIITERNDSMLECVFKLMKKKDK